MNLSNNAGMFPLVSVIVLTFQNFEGIYETLETILSQNYPNIELIISDDASEHFPEAELTQWMEEKHIRLPLRFRTNAENLGLVAHSNVAAKDTLGYFIKFLSPGDGFAHPQALTQLVQFAQRCKTEVVVSPALICRENFSNVCYEFPSPRRVNILNNRAPEQLFSAISSINTICAVGAIYARTFFDNGGFDAAYRNLDDWPTWLKIYRQGKLIPCMKKPTVFYRIGGMSSEHGTAFDSALLKNDLLRCIETEILPFVQKLSWRARMMVRYRHNELTEFASIKYRIICLPVECYCLIKKIVKHMLVNMRS